MPVVEDERVVERGEVQPQDDDHGHEPPEAGEGATYSTSSLQPMERLSRRRQVAHTILLPFIMLNWRMKDKQIWAEG